MSTKYDRDYYRAYGTVDGPVSYEQDERIRNFLAGVADRIVQGLQPKSVLDAGCAMGLLVAALRDRGVDAHGVDISDYAISRVREDVRPFCKVASLTEDLPRHYDLIVCIEVLEHLEPADAEKAIDNLCAHTAAILLSSTPDEFRDPSHVNLKPVEAWAELFARRGFLRDVDFDAFFLTPWAILFRRADLPLPSVVRRYESKFWRLWKENTDLRAALQEARGRADLFEKAVAERQEMVVARDQMIVERDQMVVARDQMIQARDVMIQERERQLTELQRTLAEHQQRMDELAARLKQIENDPDWQKMQKIRVWFH